MDTCKVLRSEAEVAALSSEWQHLHERSGWSMFTDPRWIDAWWQILGKPGGWRLHVVAGWRGGRLVAVAPLAIIRRKGLRVLQWAGGDVFDYCDSLLEDRNDAGQLWDTVRQSGNFDIARLYDIHPEATSLPALVKFSRVVRTAPTHHVRTEWPNGEAWMATRSSHTRREFKRRTRQMAEKGPYSFEVRTSGTLPAPVLDALIAQKISWCIATGKAPISGPMVRRIIELAAEDGKLHLCWIQVGNNIIAVSLGFIRGNAYYGYLHSYSPEWSHFSPGTSLEYHLIMWCMDNGMKEYDFMRGDEAFKATLCNGVRELSCLSFPGTMAGRLGDAVNDGLKIMAVMRRNFATAKTPK